MEKMIDDHWVEKILSYSHKTVSEIIILSIKWRCQSHQHTTSERKWVTQQENLLKWVINGRVWSLLVAACASLSWQLLPRNVEHKGRKGRRGSLRRPDWNCIFRKDVETTHRWVSTQHNATDQFSQEKTALMAVWGTETFAPGSPEQRWWGRCCTQTNVWCRDFHNLHIGVRCSRDSLKKNCFNSDLS